MTRALVRAAACALLATLVNACSPAPPHHPPAAHAPALHNLVPFTPGLISGALPEGDAAFDALRAMGIRTIISVDGAVPDAARATARGMRYVHLPIGYDGVSETRTLELTRAVRDLPGPVYIHCHHGKHRSPGAAGVIAVSLGLMSRDAAHAKLVEAGTSPAYPGLYACVAEATPRSAAEISAADSSFPERTRPGTLVSAMLAIDEAFEHLALIDNAGWRVPRNHPDLVPAAEAGRLADLLRVSGEQEAARGPAYARLTAAGVRAATALEAALAARPIDAPRAAAAMKLLAASCTDCHAAFRNRRAEGPAR